MTFALRFRDHQGFHRAALATLGAAAASALLGWGAMRAGLSPWWVFAPMAMALAYAFGVDRRGHDTGRHGALFAFRAVAVLAGFAALQALGGYQGLIGFGAGVGLAFAVGLRGPAAAAVGAIAGLAGVLAVEIGFRVAMASELASTPEAARAVATAVAFAAAMAVPLACRHLELVSDRVARRYATVRDHTRGEIQELVIRGHNVWSQVRDLPEDDANRALLEEAVLKLFDTAEKWGGPIDGADAESSLRERMDSLAARIEAAEDEQVRSEYQQAHAALVEQRKVLSGISTSRERVVARLHNYLAAMERLRLATLRSSSASREATDLDAMADTLTEIGRDI
jgi:hypothetical protein